MGIGVISGHGQGISANIDSLVVATRNAELVEALVEVDAVVLGRAMAYGVNGHRGSTIFIDSSNPAGIGMLMALQHEVNTVSAYQVIKHPALNQVVAALDGIKWMMQDENLPFCIALSQLFLKPLVLGPQVKELAVAVEHKELHIAIVHGVDHVILDLRVKEVGKDKREAAFQFADDAFEVVVVARHVEYRHGLTDAVERAESLGPILVGRAFNQVASTHEKLDFGVMCACVTQQSVGNAIDGVLHVADKEERELVTLLGIGPEIIPWRHLAIGNGTVAVMRSGLQLAQTRDIIGCTAHARLKDFALGIDVCGIPFLDVNEFKMRWVNHRVTLPTHVTGHLVTVTKGEQHVPRYRERLHSQFFGVAEPHVPPCRHPCRQCNREQQQDQSLQFFRPCFHLMVQK